MALKNPRRVERPTLWVIAGPNGSGKSSAYNLTGIEGWGGSVWIINPDLLTEHVGQREGVDLAAANLLAVERIEEWLNTSLDVYQTIGVETVLSSSKYRSLVERAQARGFEVRMIYVLLRSVELQIERVRLRVQSGGHDVPEEKIRSRRKRSFEQLAWFATRVDTLDILDNSAGYPDLMATKRRDEQMLWHRRPPTALRAEFAAAGLADLPPPTSRTRKRSR